MLSNLFSLFIRFFGTILQFLAGILIARFSDADITAYYFLLLSSVWITVYGLSLGFPNHIFIITSESSSDTNFLKLLKKYIYYYSRLLIPILSLIFLLFFLIQPIFLLDLKNFSTILITAAILVFNRFCSEIFKGSKSVNAGIFFDRTTFPFLIFLSTIYFSYFASFSINSINCAFLISSITSLIISCLSSVYFLNQGKENIKNIDFDNKHLVSQYILELGEVLINRLPIILLNIIFFEDSKLIAGLSICFTLISISGTINFALYPFFGKSFIKEIKNNQIREAKNILFSSQLWTGFLYLGYFTILYFFGESILSVYNSEFVIYNNYLLFYGALMIFSQFLGVSDYLMSLIRKDKLAIIFKLISLVGLLLLAYVSFKNNSVKIFLMAIFISNFLKNIISYIFHLKNLKNF